MTTAHPNQFHENEFDAETQLKLRIFREYVREWLPVFLIKRSYTSVNIFDFFSGPGSDSRGNLGSPLIILDEVIKYIDMRPVDPAVSLVLYFNDKQKEHVNKLRQKLDEFPNDARWQIEVDNLDFSEAFLRCLPRIRDKSSANLLILDQFGFKYVPPDLFAQLALCGATDLIFFITSSYVKRFVKEEATQRYMPMPTDEIASVSPRNVHRHICEYYRGCIPDSAQYYMAPFSIRSQANIYGLIFGSGSLLGLEKFLHVCWRLDTYTGEANYAIDDDSIAASGDQLSLIAEENVPKKHRQFETDLIDFLSQERRTNRDIYRFTLENGFLPKHTTVLLRSLQDTNQISVEINGVEVRKRSYYLSWEHYKDEQPKALFLYKGYKL